MSRRDRDRLTAKIERLTAQRDRLRAVVEEAYILRMEAVNALRWYRDRGAGLPTVARHPELTPSLAQRIERWLGRPIDALETGDIDDSAAEARGG
jgi:hypothetical protein